MTTTIALVRHGETDWNRQRRFQGHADVPLNQEGHRQARALAELLAPESFAHVYSSPLRRALQTADIVAARLGAAIEPNESLIEVDVGSWSGLTVDEVEVRFPDGFRRWVGWGTGWEDGETYDQLGARVVAGLVEIAEQHPGEDVLAITHGGPIRSAIASARRLPFESSRADLDVVENCAVVRIAVRDGILEAVH